MEMYLNILDNCHISGLAQAIDLIFEKYLLASIHSTTTTNGHRHRCNVTLKIRAATILSKKLNSLKMVSDTDTIYDILSELQYWRIVEYCQSNKSNEM